ncbi:MAG: c-type cytochrome [Campylobacterota bacterium]|nr:c-type cytochrome [Campylobacterota bacterium]
MLKLLLLSFTFVSLFSGEKDFELGEKLYKETCVSCHGVDGNAQTKMHFIVDPRNLKDSILNEEQSYQIIKKGTHYWGSAADIMPSFESVYNEKQLRSIAHYISQSFNPNSQKRVQELYAQSQEVPQEKLHKMLKRGKKIYNRNCSWCHGLTGKGDGEATKNPEMSIFPYSLQKTILTNEQMFLYSKYGGKFWGTHKDDMPSWKKKYDDYTLKSVIKYVDTKFRNNK